MCVCQDFLQRAELEAELSGFCLKFGFDLLLLMTISFTESKEPIRELAVFSHSVACREEVHTADTHTNALQYCKYTVHYYYTCSTSSTQVSSPPQVSLHLEQACNPALNLCPVSSPHPHITAYQQGKLLLL